MSCSPPTRYAILTASRPVTETVEHPNRAADSTEAPVERRDVPVEKLLPALEAILFSSPRPVREKDLGDLLEATTKSVARALQALAEKTDQDERGVRLEKVAGGWRFVTRPEFDALLRKFHEVTER